MSSVLASSKQRLAVSLGICKPVKNVPALLPSVRSRTVLSERSLLNTARYNSGITRLSLLGDGLDLSYSPPGYARSILFLILQLRKKILITYCYKSGHLQVRHRGVSCNRWRPHYNHPQAFCNIFSEAPSHKKHCQSTTASNRSSEQHNK